MIRQYIQYGDITSTNDLIQIYPPYTIVTATSQSAGRGTHGRHWLSLAGGLYMSYSIKSSDISDMALLSLASGLAVHRCITEIEPNTPYYLKWINDIWTANKSKLAGILIERKKDITIIGIGLNTSMQTETADIATLNTSKTNNTELAIKIITELNNILKLSPAKIQDQWWARSIYQIYPKVQYQDNTYTAIGLRPTGELILSCDSTGQTTDISTMSTHRDIVFID